MGESDLRALIPAAKLVSGEARNDFYRLDLYTIAVVLERKGGGVAGHVLLDAADLSLVASFRWSLHTSGYAQTAYEKGRVWGNRMYRLVTGTTSADKAVEFVDEDRLNLTRTNMRISHRVISGSTWREDLKICRDCSEAKPATEYHAKARSSDGLQPRCKDCNNAQSKRWRERYPQRHKRAQRRVSLRSLYGLSIDEYESMNSAQGGLCAACGNPCRRGGHLAVDHCHKTGRIRSLLCSGCNVALGYMQENPIAIRKLAAYIESQSAT